MSRLNKLLSLLSNLEIVVIGGISFWYLFCLFIYLFIFDLTDILQIIIH